MISHVDNVSFSIQQSKQRRKQSFGSVAEIGFTLKKFNYDTQEFIFFRVFDKNLLKSLCISFIRNLKPVENQNKLFDNFNGTIWNKFRDFNPFYPPHARSIDSKFNSRRLILFGDEAQNIKDACVEKGVGFHKGDYIGYVRSLENNASLRVRDKNSGEFLCLDITLSESSKKKYDFESLRILPKSDFLRVRPPQFPLLQHCSEFNNLYA